MSISFKNFPKGSTVGSGSYVFRHYGSEAPATETWVINATPTPSNGLTVFINFVSNSESFARIYMNNIPAPPPQGSLEQIYYQSTSQSVGSITAYDLSSGGQTNQAYRTVTFETPPTGTLLTQLQANAVKQ